MFSMYRTVCVLPVFAESVRIAFDRFGERSVARGLRFFKRTKDFLRARVLGIRMAAEWNPNFGVPCSNKFLIC